MKRSATAASYSAAPSSSPSASAPRRQKRSILGVSAALSEAEVHWRTFLTSLQKRGWHGLQLIVSDDHAGLGAARADVFPSVPWQRG